jgi:hypothetical protein
MAGQDAAARSAKTDQQSFSGLRKNQPHRGESIGLQRDLQNVPLERERALILLDAVGQERGLDAKDWRT